MSNQSINFVKFLRGSEEQYNNLQVKDKNTLYFIYDKDSTEDHPTGKLYLEKFLIGGNSSDLHSVSLKDLTDTTIGTLTGDEILKFDKTSETWKPVLVSDILSGITSQNTVIHSNIIKQEDESDTDAISRVFNNTSNPGDIGILSNGTVYLSDSNDSWLKLIDGSVRNADIPGMVSNISSIQSSLSNIYTKNETETKINELIAEKNHLSYVLGTDTSSIDINDSNNYNKIFLIPKDLEEAEENNLYNEFMIINGSLEKVGDWQVNLDNYIQAGDERLLTPEQKEKLDNLVIDEHGQTVISGTVNANNVEGLQDFINNNQYIKSVDTQIFNVTNAGKLELLNTYVTLNDFNSTVGLLDDLGENRIAPDSTIVSEINKIKESIIWTEMT